MVLAGSHGHHILAIRQHNERGFLACEEFFNHHACATFVVLHTVLVVHQHEVHGIVCFLQGHGNNHTLACGQAIGLDHDRSTQTVHESVGCNRVSEGVIVRRRNAMAAHEGLGESLGRLQLRCSLGRAKDLQTMVAEFIHHTSSQRCLRADHGQRNAFRLCPFTQRHHIRDVYVLQLAASQCRARIAGCHKHLGCLGRLRQFPRQCVLAATAANHKNFHKSAL